MSKELHRCPFHTNSSAVEVDGEIQNIHCSECGDYRISNTALEELSGQTSAPKGWRGMLRRRALVSTRDTHLLAV